MRRNIGFIIITFLLISVLVSGAMCQPLKKPKAGEELTGTQLKQIRTGTDALYMEFVKNVPPDQVYDTDLLTVVVNLKNKGAENIGDIDGAWFYLGGFDRNIVPFDTEGIPLSEAGVEYIPGKYELRGEEGETALTFSTQLKGLPEGTDVYDANMILTACYPYKTMANPIICIDSNPFGTYTASKACQPQTVSEAGGQGGPIIVTSVAQTPMKGKVQFKITIENKGKGKAISAEKYTTCNQIESSDYKYVNMIDGYSIGAGGLNNIKCQPDPENLRLMDERAVIVCSADIQESVPAYTTPLNIILDYHYMESTQPKKVRIINI
jgi:hypothetical protein